MTTCPGRGQLERLLENRLVDTELDELEQHIEACAACQQTLDELSDTTNWRLERRGEVLITRDGGEAGSGRQRMDRHFACKFVHRRTIKRANQPGRGSRMV